MKAIELDDFLKFKYLSNVAISPEGGSACLTVTTADRRKNGYKSHLYLYREGKFSRLTAGGKERSFQYLDEDTILFPGNREDEEAGDNKAPELKSRWYRISLKGGEAELAYTFPIPVSQVLPLPNGDMILKGSTFPGFEDLYKGDRKLLKEFQKQAAENADYEEIAQVPWWWNGGSFTKGGYESLFYYDHRRKALTRLTDVSENVMDARLSPDKSVLYYMTSPVKPLLPMEGEAVLKAMAVKEDGPVVPGEALAGCSDELELMGFLPGETFLLVLASDKHLGLNTDADFYRIDYGTRELKFYAKHGEAIGSSVGSDIRYGGGRSARMVGDTLYFISTRFDGAYLYKLEDGEITQLTKEPGSVDCFDISEDGTRAMLIALRDMRAQEVYDLKGRRLSRFNDSVLRGKYVAEPESLDIKVPGEGPDASEIDIHGFVLKPMDYDPEKKYPVIIDIHGGPKTVYGQVYYHEMQYWAGKGYFVIFCNPRGSDGRGDFMDILGKYGTIDYEDIMAFCDAALEAYPAMDGSNFFETGGSYGGFMTNWIIGHTDRFRACASQRSISNWFSMYGVSDIGVVFAQDQCLSDPWNEPEKLWEQSPMKYADKAVTPTLFIHSFEDYRCPIDQGYQMFTSLVAHGVEAKMVCFKGENHELSRSGKPAHRIKRLKEITKWFDDHKVCDKIDI